MRSAAIAEVSKLPISGRILPVQISLCCKDGVKCQTGPVLEEAEAREF